MTNFIAVAHLKTKFIKCFNRQSKRRILGKTKQASQAKQVRIQILPQEHQTDVGCMALFVVAVPDHPKVALVPHFSPLNVCMMGQENALPKLLPHSWMYSITRIIIALCSIKFVPNENQPHKRIT